MSGNLMFGLTVLLVVPDWLLELKSTFEKSREAT